MGKKLYVGNLPFSVTEQDLGALFSETGTVAAVSIITHRDSGRSKGFGFVEMSTEEEAQTAVSKLNGYELEGRALTVAEARPQEDRPAREDRGGGFRGGRGGRSDGDRRGGYRGNDDMR